jgi:hypothetical protein
MLIGRIKQANPSIRICLVGDFKQLKPINDIVGKGFDYEGSYGVWWICDGTRVELTKNRRVVDKDSHKLVDIFMHPDKVDRSIFPTKECERSICYTNLKRKQVNDAWMKRKAPTDYIELEKAPTTKSGYENFCWLTSNCLENSIQVRHLQC